MASDLEKKKAVYSLQSLYQKNSTFWIKALQVKNDTIEILEENTQKIFKSEILYISVCLPPLWRMY